MSWPDPASLSADFEPALVDPAVPPEAIHDDADMLVTTDGDALLNFVERDQDSVDDGNRSLLRTPVRSGTEAFTKFWFAKTRRVAFILRNARDARALVITRTETDNLVPWIRGSRRS